MSALPSDTKDSVVTDFPKAKGPGARLKSARLVKELDISYVAKQLHLSDETIIALEADDFEHLPAKVFIKGYLKNYAKFVELPVEAILKAFDDNEPEIVQAEGSTKVKFENLGSQANNIFKSESSVSSKSSNIIVWLIVFLIIGGFVAWSKDLITLPGNFLDTNTSSIPVSLLPENKLLLSQPTESNVSPISIKQESVEPVIESTPIPIISEPLSAPKVLSESISAPKVLSEPITETAVEQTVENTPVKIEVPENIVPTPIVENIKQEIVFTFSEACWVDIRDSSGSFRYVNQVKAGTVKRISGKSPYKILLGNANGVSMTINGEPFDLQEYTKANVARFTLDL